jgi:AcrR family transcriptional regulator
VIEIAKRAGVTKSTFFRHFSDKRQVLFGQDVEDRAFKRGSRPDRGLSTRRPSVTRRADKRR